MKGRIIVIVLVFMMWIYFIWFLKVNADYLKGSPCSICAMKVGEDVTCTTMGRTKVYHPNGTIEDIVSIKPVEEITNFTLIEDVLE